MNSHIRPQIPTLHVTEIDLPRELEQLYELAYNLRWSWTPPARDLFSSIDSAKWALYRNPVQLLINVDPKRWYPLLDNEAFRARYDAVVRDFEDYMQAREPTWFARHHGDAAGEKIAYFSMEYGLHQSLAIYSGGLGVLSGDHCKAASDLGLPLVAVGLLYRRGYFQQTLDADGLQQHTYPEYDFTRLPLRPIATATGREATVAVPLPGPRPRSSSAASAAERAASNSVVITAFRVGFICPMRSMIASSNWRLVISPARMALA